MDPEAVRELSQSRACQNLKVGDVVQDYGTVEWIEVYEEGPNVLVDFVGHTQGTWLARSLHVRVTGHLAT